MPALTDNVVAAALAVLLWLFSRRFFSSQNSARRAKAAGQPHPSTLPGDFQFPPVTPLQDFDVKALEATKPLPFRPFRWGRYPQHMAIRPLTNLNNWLHLDNHYSWVHSVKTERTNDPSLLCTTTLPGHHAAALEGLCEICSFLSVRFPLLFKVERASYDADKPETHGDSVVGKESGAIIAVETCITGEKFDFRQIEEEEGPEWNPMRVAGLLLEDGVIVLVEDEQGQYRFQASSMCTSGFWRLKDKIGMTLDEIHFSGAVPNYAEKYQKAINKFFAGMKEEKFFERNNYFFQVDEKLGWSEATNGTEEVFDHTDKKPREEQFKPEGGHTQPRAATDINQIHFRTERQSMRRLPKSRAILFTTRSYLFPVTDLADEPGIPGRMASSVRSWPSEGNRNVDWYKASDLFAPVLLPYLDKKHAKQVASGVVQLNEKGETERTIRVERRLWKATVPFSKVARSRSWLLSSLSRSARLLQT